MDEMSPDSDWCLVLEIASKLPHNELQGEGKDKRQCCFPHHAAQQGMKIENWGRQHPRWEQNVIIQLVKNYCCIGLSTNGQVVKGGHGCFDTLGSNLHHYWCICAHLHM